MFLQTSIMGSGQGDITRTFVRSTNVTVFPCGRRRGQIENDRYLPFDPEARLNTEYNQRKATGSAGYSQTFVQNIDFINRLASNAEFQPKGSATFVLAGYVFTLEANQDSMRITSAVDGCDYLGKAILAALGETVQTSDTERIYANIKLATVPLYEGNAQDLYYDSWVLRDQTAETSPRTCLDLLKDAGDRETATDYYFSGLSFSRAPMAYDRSNVNSTVEVSYVYPYNAGDKPDQIDVSLCILVKQAGSDTWKLNQQALLPNVRHGEETDSVEVTSFNATNVVKQAGKPVTVLEIDETQEKPRLKFTFGNQIN